MTNPGVLLVHGGVAGILKETPPDLSPALAVASSSALDAVEQAVRVLEDNPALNAGLGSVLNRMGRLELDAGIADGASGKVGGVANVSVRHPVSLARRVMEETPHVLLTGSGASSFGAQMSSLDESTQEQRERWQRAKADGSLDLDNYGAPEHVDTVGAVALGTDGHLAAASSTGGVFGKMPGRVGDAPIFGAGLYASAAVAVVGTGVGELFLETLACMRVGALVEQGASPQEACEEVISFLGKRQDTAAGILALDASGAPGAAFRGGSWAVASSAGPLEARQLP
jgi:beta-aspartyl-peptidase (threonine type)